MARNICLRQNGDLADQRILEISPDRWLPSISTDGIGYWIGLRQHRLVWVNSDVQGAASDVKMTYFANNNPSTILMTEMCMSIKYSGQWVWEMRQCQGLPTDGYQYEGLEVVCHRSTANQPVTTPVTGYDPVPHLQLGQMVGIIVGSVAFFVLAIVLTVLVTRSYLGHKLPCSTKRYDESTSPQSAGQQVHDLEPIGSSNGSNPENFRDSRLYDDTFGQRVNNNRPGLDANQLDDDVGTYDDTKGVLRHQQPSQAH
jgi:hypothetical protein